VEEVVVVQLEGEGVERPPLVLIAVLEVVVVEVVEVEEMA
jgi:hypothetical protein